MMMLDWLVAAVADWSYAGIVLLMAIESSFIPFPSEVVLIPAGYLAQQGIMNPLLVLIASLLGSLIGAFVNYGLALWVGRPFLERYGRYVLISPPTLHKTDRFFARHGAISTFTGRLIPGIRQLISIPAGLARMPLIPFALYTALGAGLWSLVLIALGYVIGDNAALIREHLTLATSATLIGVALMLLIYVLWMRRRQPE
ncbi:membrane protein DedA, SNARE-associated domain [Allochromatium warmingii]|uniref:Membrane protein DedA, SNARE-associated domain n=1 Tax=Allochromatium warmingii TaxID=61595 RepID=A0A1H3F7F6_ALLWA|nr:DedA family protein [Allochromatium warmingii]SDX86089.1 membrane protein DedA, SNARE-associated domain [Allochromatium warmingii]